MSQLETSTKQMSWWARGSRPIWLVVMFWFLLNLGAPAVYRWWNPDSTFSEVVEGGFFGVLAGQVCFAALAGGLRWRPWGLGYAIGIVITTIGLLGLVIGFALVDDHDNEAFLYLAILPPVLLSLTAPLFVFRFAFGWNLVAKHEATPTRESVRIEDLFHVTAVTAAMLVLLRIPPVTLNESRGYWPMMIVFCGIAFAIGLLVLPICVWLALGVFFGRTIIRVVRHSAEKDSRPLYGERAASADPADGGSRDTTANVASAV